MSALDPRAVQAAVTATRAVLAWEALPVDVGNRPPAWDALCDALDAYAAAVPDLQQYVWAEHAAHRLLGTEPIIDCTCPGCTEDLD
jgi:hypothetical protein